MKDSSLLIRRATSADLPEIRELFRETVRNVNSRDYDARQIEAWSGRADDEALWKQRLNSQHMIVCWSGAAIAGFASITADGYLDCLFVHYGFQSMGVAGALFQEMKKFAENDGCIEITADVSITARPFFERMGFDLFREQQVAIGNTVFTNFKMTMMLL
jgi:putative acetyltransferase